MAALASMLLLAQPLAAAPTITILDGDFEPANWTHEVRFDSGFSTVNTAVAQIGSGGVPGAYRNIGYAMDHNGTQIYGTVYVLNRFGGGSYTPSAQGAINFIDYSEQQTRTGSNWAPALVGANPLIFQGGKVFLGPGFNFGPNDFSWTTHTDTNLVASEFMELNGMSVIVSSNPDFGLSGGTMQFGYARANSYSFDSSISHAIDNWSFALDVTPVPEPSTCVMAAGLLALALRRCRRRRESCRQEDHLAKEHRGA